MSLNRARPIHSVGACPDRIVLACLDLQLSLIARALSAFDLRPVVSRSVACAGKFSSEAASKPVRNESARNLTFRIAVAQSIG